MHFDVAPRVANRLDIEIRALSRKLREQMTPGSGKEEEGGSSGLRHTIPAPFSVIFAHPGGAGFLHSPLGERGPPCGPQEAS